MNRPALFILSLVIMCAAILNVQDGYGAGRNERNRDVTQSLDTLRNLIDTTSIPELRKIYPLWHNWLYQLNDIETHLEFNRLFTGAARKGGVKETEALGRGFTVEILSNYKQPDSLILSEAFRALDFMREIPEAEGHYFYTTTFITDLYILKGDYEDALEAAHRFYDEARKKNNDSGIAASLLSMAKAYEGLELYDKAEVSFREALSYVDEKKGASVKCQAYHLLILVLNKLERYDEALEACREFEEFLDLRESSSGIPGEVSTIRFTSDLSYAQTYTHMKDYDRAWEYIRRAETRSPYSTGHGIFILEQVRYIWLMDQRRYAEAEQVLDLIDRTIGEEAFFHEKLRQKERRADLYHRWGLFGKASDSYKEYIVQKDSVQRMEMAEKLNSIRTRYEVDRLEMEKEQQKITFRSTVRWLTVVLILLCCIITVAVLDTRRVRSKNRSLLERMREQDKLEADNDQLRNELARQDVSAQESEEEESDKLGKIYLQLKELMNDPEVFTDPAINRKMIAAKLGTNEKYVFDTIHRYYDMNIQSYITNIRLNYARNLLALPRDSRTIETIALESGFNSRATFHRLFRERYGMTPSEFRRLVTGSGKI